MSKLMKEEEWLLHGRSEKDGMCIGHLSDGSVSSCIQILPEEVLLENIILCQNILCAVEF